MSLIEEKSSERPSPKIRRSVPQHPPSSKRNVRNVPKIRHHLDENNHHHHYQKKTKRGKKKQIQKRKKKTKVWAGRGRGGGRWRWRCGMEIDINHLPKIEREQGRH